MFNLIRNEQIKLFLQKSTWFMFIALAAIVFLVVFIMRPVGETMNFNKDNWRQQLEKENKELEKDIKDPKIVEEAKQYYMQELETNNYYLKNDLQPNKFGAWQFVLESKDFLSVLSLLVIIVAAGIVANEYRWGTIKLLLIRPITRTKILLAKYISVLLFALVGLIFFMVLSWIAGAVFFGVEGLNPKVALYTDGKVIYESIVSNIFKDFGYKLVNLVMMVTFAFMVSTVFRNSAMSIGISIFLMMAGNSIVTFLANKSWVKYVLFANTDLTQYTTGYPLAKGMTLGFSITMLIVYYVVFMLLSWISFSKRDVAGA